MDQLPLPTCICLTAGMQSGSLKLFANVDQKPMLLKRQAFAMFSGELDQYHLYLPLIQGMPLVIFLIMSSLSVGNLKFKVTMLSFIPRTPPPPPYRTSH